MEKINIKYKYIDTSSVEKLDNGAYLIKEKINDLLIVMIKNKLGLSFLEKDSFIGFNDLDYDDFYDNYELLGEIDTLKISEIKLK